MHPGRSNDPADVDDRAVRRLVRALALVGVVVAVVVVAITGGPSGVGTAGSVLLAWAACVAAGSVHLALPVHGTREASTLSELAQVPVVLLLAPADALLAVVLASVLAETWLTRGQVLRVAFNVSWATTAVGLAALLRWWLLPMGFVHDVRGVAVAVLVAVCIVAVNTAAFAGVVAVRARRRWWDVAREELGAAVAINVGLGLVGGLVAVLLVTAPAALVLLLVPLGAQGLQMQVRRRAHVQLAAERARLERTVEGASDGIILLDRFGRVEVWNPVVAALTGVSAAAASGRTLEQLGLGDVVTAIDGGPSHVGLSGRVLEVRVGSDGSAAGGGVVVTLRDVSREEELAQIRGDLVSLVSHELRTPVTTLTGFLHTLDGHWDDLADTRRHELLVAARRGGDRLGALVTNLVAWARVERAVVEDDRTWSAVVGEVLPGVLEHGDSKVARRGELAAAVRLHPDDLATVLRNLVDNALEYGAPPVWVEVDRGPAEDAVRIHVVDHGPGLPDDFHPVLFEPWRQATSGLRRTARGIGMGLAVSRAIAEIAGGSIDHADVPGGGSRFTVTLPAD